MVTFNPTTNQLRKDLVEVNLVGVNVVNDSITYHIPKTSEQLTKQKN